MAVKIVVEALDRMGTKSRDKARRYVEAQITKYQMCIGCHACESRCPFGVPIAERMEKTAKLFGC